MKKILSILICVLIPIVAFSASKTFYGRITFYQTGEGTMEVAEGTKSLGNWSPGTYNPKTKGENFDFSAKAFKLIGTPTEATSNRIYFKATPATGYYFDKWAASSAGDDEYNKNAEYNEEFTLKGDQSNPTKFIRYAVFKQYVYGTENRTAEAVPTAWGEVSLDGSNWGPTASKTDGTAIKIKQEETISLTYYAQTKGTNTFFLGWYDGPDIATAKLLSEESPYTHKYTPSSKDSNAPTQVPTLYALFGKRAVYMDHATAQAVYVDHDGNYVEIGDLSNIGWVSINNATPSTPSAEYGTQNVTSIAVDALSGTYSYTYYASAQDGYKFLGWSLTSPEVGKEMEILENSDVSPYTYTHSTSIVDDNNAPTPAKLYAVFKQNTYFYHTGARAGFATNGEKGKITVTGTVYNATNGTPNNSYSLSTTDADINDETVYRVEPINATDYTFTYTAVDTDPAGEDKSVFKGWSRSPMGENIFDKSATITYPHTTYSTDPDQPYAPSILYAIFRSYWYKDPTVQLTTSSAGAGQVAVVYSDDETVQPSVWKNEVSADDAQLHQVPALDEYEESGYTYSVCYWAKPAFGAKFLGWADADDPNRILADDRFNPYKVQYAVKNTDDENPFVPSRLYAVFQSVISVIQKDRMIYYLDENGNDNINDANVIINFNAADILHAELIEDDLNANLFVLSDKQRVSTGKSIDLDATSGIIQLVLSYKGKNPKDHVGRTAVIRLSATYNDGTQQGTVSIDVPITIEERPTVSFLPTDGKGAYSIKHTDGRGIGYSMPIDATANINVPIALENMATFELDLTEDKAGDGVAFAGWEMIANGVTTWIGYEKKITYSFNTSASVRPVFMAENKAVFTLLTCDGNYYDNFDTPYKDLNTPYYNLQEALNVAQKRYEDGLQKQIVVFSNDGKKEGVLESGNYTIPAGVTLLIPGVGPTPTSSTDQFKMEHDDDKIMEGTGNTATFKMNKYVYREKRPATVNDVPMDVVLTTDDYFASGTTPVCYRKLVVNDNTTITVRPGGSINMYAYIATNSSHYEARPQRYGQIALGENSKIILAESYDDNRAQLYAFGYITGPQSSGVIAQKGSEVFELLQYTEHRGGAGIAHLYMNNKEFKTFPFSQYYCQNIEVPLELHYGAVENVTTSAYVLSTEYVLMSGFIVPDDSKYTSGFLRMGTNTTLIKYYDTKNDRLKLCLNGAGGEVKVGYIDVHMGNLTEALKTAAGNVLGGLAGLAFSDVQLKSSDYVMPINNNIDVVLNNVKFSTPYDIAFLAGSTLLVDKQSEVVINNGANVYLYDADENRLPTYKGTNNYGAGTGYFSAGNYSLCPITYLPNGGVQQKSNATTNVLRKSKDVKDAMWIVDGKVTVNGGFYTTDGKAQIISNTKGKVQFTSNLTDKTTIQAKYKGGGGSALLTGGVDGVHERVYYTVHSAQLKNADNTWVDTKNTTATYTYNPVTGKWVTGSVAADLQGSDMLVTLPDYDVTTPAIDPYKSDVVLTGTGMSSAQISWDGGATYTTLPTPTIVGTNTKVEISYTPTNIAGKYEGILKINGGTSYQRLTVTEDYTPLYDVPEQYTMTAYLGSTANQSANIVAATNNVSGIFTGNFANRLTWAYAITGENADEFTFSFGTGANTLSGAKLYFTPKMQGTKSATLSLTATYKDAANVEHVTNVAIPITGTVNTLAPNPLAFADNVDSMFVGAEATRLFANVPNNNSKPVVITFKPTSQNIITTSGSNMNTMIAPKNIGVVEVTATQEADIANGIAATEITTTITVTDNIVWNWEYLYFGSENKYPISTLYTNWTLQVKDNHLNVIREFNAVKEGDYEVILESWPDGEAQPIFELTYNDGTGEKKRDFHSNVSRDPRHLSVYVNDNQVYEAITLNVDKVDSRVVSSDFMVRFQSTNTEISQWTLYFNGIPDKLSFQTTSGTNNWQIEESENGINWSIAHSWAPIKVGSEFELSLQPSTNYVRISYGTDDPNSYGVLSKVAITELISVKADVEKLYMPIINPSSKKSVVFTYVSEAALALKTSHAVFTTAPSELQGNNQEPFYTVKRVDVTSKATQEMTDGLLSVTGTTTAVPIRTYNYPQPIPIQLASDELERYYFVTSESYNTSWTNDDATRAIVMRNAVADAAPYVVFHFHPTDPAVQAPAPGVISFNYTGTKGHNWSVQESADGVNWYDLSVNTASETEGFVMRNFTRPETSCYVRVRYDSDYAGIVEITNLAILPTTSVVVDPTSLVVFSDQNEKLNVLASNLHDITFKISDGFSIVNNNGSVMTANDLTTLFAKPGTNKNDIYIDYTSTAAITQGTLVITTSKDAEGNDLGRNEELAVVELTGINRNLPVGASGLYTGVGQGFSILGKWEGEAHRPINTAHAFAGTTPLFDYVIIYGETTTTDGSKNITTPTSIVGSNAKTPCYIYKKSGNIYILESLDYFIENANRSSKSWKGIFKDMADTNVDTPDDDPEHLRVYITGFCPYASTGYTQSDEGVWYFRGDAGDKIDIYLEDCYIYSRYKSKRGNVFTRESGESYSDKVARGSGAVLLFACNTQKEGLTTPFEVTIHTRGNNMLKSHYGCLFSSLVGRAYQISSPVQIYMQTADHYANSYTTLTFDNQWPTAATVDGKGNFTTLARTNGFLSLQKQVNNAPSIDMGNKNTVVNFRGGHVELENACISSDNYESSLAISYRTGVYGPAKFRFTLSHGIGTDGVDGTVNFYDGTTTVKKMYVPERFRQYYLMDKDGENTSCLRSQKNTYVYGGSHCMMRACDAPTSKGGAPTDGISALGKYEYTADKGWEANTTETENAENYGWVTPTAFPDECLTKYYNGKYSYGLKSVMPIDGKLNFWIPDLDCTEFNVTPEVDQKISFWKASMTLIEASYGIYEGSVGGAGTNVIVEDGVQKEQVQNLLYCTIDQNISDVIAIKENNQYKYTAPVLNPAPDGGYLKIRPTNIGTELQNYMTNTTPYRIEDKVYYVTTIPQADVWINFTAPFKVEKIYVVETYDEELLAASGQNREEILAKQAIHNADFAAFFGVAIALESKKTFDLIYRDYLGWVREQDGSTDKRGMKQLQHYYETYDAEGKYESSNWRDADYYLYKNTANWILDATGNFTTEWGYIPVDVTQQNGQVLLEQGETYSMMFPYCTGCWEYDDEKGYHRNDWDYWSGKFIIFESTQGPHIIQGSNYMASEKPATGEWAFKVTVPENEAKLMGNSTFAKMTTDNTNIYAYAADPMSESYAGIRRKTTIEPTATFLLSNFTGKQMPARVSRTGEIIYDKENTPTGNIPTVGGGNDLFITSTATGINIAVAEPQQVRVLSSTGAVLYSGMVQTAVDVFLPTAGVYVITGENEVHKILH